MLAAAAAGGRKENLIRPGLRKCDQLFHTFDRQRWMHRQYARRLYEERDGSEVLNGVVIELVERRCNRVTHRLHEQRIAIGRRTSDLLGRDRAAGTGAILGDDLLSPCFGELLTEQPSGSIDSAAGRKRNDETDRFGRVTRGVLRVALKC